MAETTADETEMTRGEAARYLRSIADELGSGSGRVEIPIGNKEVRLSPSETIDVETTVTELSRQLRKDTEAMTLTFKWDVARDNDASRPEPDRESETDGGTEPRTDPEAV